MYWLGDPVTQGASHQKIPVCEIRKPSLGVLPAMLAEATQVELHDAETSIKVNNGRKGMGWCGILASLPSHGTVWNITFRYLPFVEWCGISMGYPMG